MPMVRSLMRPEEMGQTPRLQVEMKKSWLVLTLRLPECNALS